MPITTQQLLQNLPNAGQSAGVFVSVLNTAMNHYQIVGVKHVLAFIAQTGHESGQLSYVKEIWGPTKAQVKYEGRADLGNTVADDGSVIPPFLILTRNRDQATRANFRLGVMPPRARFGRS